MGETIPQLKWMRRDEDMSRSHPHSFPLHPYLLHPSPHVNTPPNPIFHEQRPDPEVARDSLRALAGLASFHAKAMQEVVRREMGL